VFCNEIIKFGIGTVFDIAKSVEKPLVPYLQGIDKRQGPDQNLTHGQGRVHNASAL
jgi:hypothetical protein